ncbi:MAG TPA: hypothetical protein VIP57_03955 [Candidatus Dormibacteraeota bacterium]
MSIKILARAFAVTAMAALLFAASQSPAATARIVPGKGIVGVAIGASMKHVREVLGTPDRIRPPSWGYGAPLRGRVSFDHKRRVSDVWTISQQQRTPRGIGPGSSLARVKGAYPRARCHGRRAHKICIVDGRLGKRRVRTDFLFHGRLWKVDVYLLPAKVKPGPS